MNIEYKFEVLKYYPESSAWVTPEVVFEIRDRISGKIIGSSENNVRMAWKDAYYRLQKENDSPQDNCSEI